MELVISAIKEIRARRTEMNVPPSKKTKMFIVSDDKNAFSKNTEYFFQKLAGASDVEFPDEHNDDEAVRIITDKAVIFIPLAEMLDIEKEIARLEGERLKLIGEIERIDKKLSNEGFVAKAPAAVVEGEKAKREGYADKLALVVENIEKYKKM